ncbi:hypothetical protein [uncultured Roseobacter sp.]|uniref:hypothetical protein n=1 Tax=uncultured Roseobacter sp. TaxID=114847 RepID=UPI00262DA5CF|nr:hypothetical protein [uncultured Roseobacter sp.]
MNPSEKPSGAQHVVYPFDDFESVFQRIDKRISAIERATIMLERELAVAEEKRKFVEQRFNEVDRRLDRIDGHISRLVWLIIAAIIGGFMSFVMRGAMFGV